MNIINISDFQTKGKFELHTGMFDNPRVQEYIDKYEKKYLINLFGVALYMEFELDLILGTGTPTELRFVKVFEPFAIDRCGSVIYSEGIKEMLKGFIYYEYVKDLTNQMSSIGNVVPVGENSENGTTLYSMMFNRYNEAAANYKAIQYWISFNNDAAYNYDGFSGNAKGFVYWI
jgi:hypothetical protein